jgi:hypothetical protein
VLNVWGVRSSWFKSMLDGLVGLPAAIRRWRKVSRLEQIANSNPKTPEQWAAQREALRELNKMDRE